MKYIYLFFNYLLGFILLHLKVLCLNMLKNIYDCFEILKVCNSYNNLLAVEALLIKKCQPNLNNKLGPYKGSRVKIKLFK